MHSEEFKHDIFSYKMLEKASKTFSTTKKKCVHSACGTIYAGRIIDGHLVSIKGIHFGSSHGVDQLLNDISIFSTMKQNKTQYKFWFFLLIEFFST